MVYLVVNNFTYACIDSECLDITCGMPQWSVLGPLLFMLCANDFSELSKVQQKLYLLMMQLFTHFQKTHFYI